MDSSTAEEWPVYGYIVRGTCCTTYLPEQTYSPKDRHTDHDIALPTETPLPALYTYISSIIEADDVRVDIAPATVQHNTATLNMQSHIPEIQIERYRQMRNPSASDQVRICSVFLLRTS